MDGRDGRDFEVYALTVLRVGTGLLFMEHGAQKLFGALGGLGGPGIAAPLGSLFGVAGILELFGGALIALGLLTRPVALLLLVEMLVAYFWRHMPRDFWPLVNRGELALLYALVYLYLSVRGPGPYSVDAAFTKRGLRLRAAEVEDEPEP